MTQIPERWDAAAAAPDGAMERIAQRLENLEMKASFAEDMLDQLNMTIYQQQQLIERLVHEITHLRQEVPDGGHAAVRHLRDELPPHY